MVSSFACLCVMAVFFLGSRPVTNAASPVFMAERHEQWMALHGRVYQTQAEKERRLKIFQDNVNFIESFNRAGQYNYTLGVNHFADMTHDEVVASRTGRLRRRASTSTLTAALEGNNASVVVPATVDWRAKGAVTKIKNQGICGSCWAFSAVASMEGAVQLKTGKLVELSVQQLVDCDTEGGNDGCGGGYMDGAFQFIIKNGGLTTEAGYPYTGTQAACDAKKKTPVAATISGYEDVPKDQAGLLQAVARQPVSLGIDNSDLSFVFYAAGVYNGPCRSKINHALVAVGYGTTPQGDKYWLMKNSWGSDWGESGYIRIARGDEGPGICGITSLASYPIA